MLPTRFPNGPTPACCRWIVLILFCAMVRLYAVDGYVLGPDSTIRDVGAPVGRVEPFTFQDSKVFPGTQRDGWVYLPAQLDPAQPAALMVFQDGHAYVSTNGQMRVPIVFDNLIARGEMPVTVGVFINPGHAGTNPPPATGWGNRSNRSVEYDSLGDAYARFLIEELLPFVQDRFKVNLSADPELRAICGMSSGGICAFTAAWERPDQFRKVLSHIGSFTDIRGGHVYPALIRKAARKPLRVFLQDGSNDLNNNHGSWPLANQQMANSLAYLGYDHRFVFGDGAHNGKHGGVILPDSLRWLWRDVAPRTRRESPGEAESAARLASIPRTTNDWQLVGEGYGFTDAACSDAQGRFYFSDLGKSVLYRVDSPEAAPVKWLENGPKISGMKFGPDGRLYAATQGEAKDKRIIAIDPQTKAIEVIAVDVQPNDLVVTRTGFVFFTDTGAGQVVRVPITARSLSRPAPVAGGIEAPNGIALSPDGRWLYVSEYRGRRVWSYSLTEEGLVRGGERVQDLVVPEAKTDSGGDGMATDGRGRLFITSHLGVQVFEPANHRGIVIARPQEKATVSCGFGGVNGDWLFACASDKVYRLRLQLPGSR